MAAKLFEVNEVLPATTIKITGYSDEFGDDYDEIRVYLGIQTDESIGIYDNQIYVATILEPYFTNGILDLSSFNEQERTVIDVIRIDYSGQSYLVWEVYVTGYSITYEENGGSVQTDLTGQTALPDPLPTPTKSGYTFVNWYYDSAFTQKAKAGDTIESNVTLYAKWHNLGSLFTEIADAIRSKDGTSENIRDVDFGERIRDLDTCIYLTQEEYDLLDPPNENITYIIVEVE